MDRQCMHGASQLHLHLPAAGNMGFCAVWVPGMHHLVTCGAVPACAHRLHRRLAHTLPAACPWCLGLHLNTRVSHRAKFRVNAANRTEGFCTLEGLPSDLLVRGDVNQNR